MLQSLTLEVDPVEDRLLLRLVDNAQGSPREVRLHLTRRLCQQLRSDLQRLADWSAQPPERLDAQGRATVSAVHHAAMVQQAKVAAAPPPVVVTPALLATGVACGRRREDGRWVLRVDVRDGEPATLVLTDASLHGFVALLRRQSAAAHWALPELPGDRQPAPAAVEATARNFH